MNHRRRRRGYHSRVALGITLVLTTASLAAAPATTELLPPNLGSAGSDLRAMVLARINAARADHGVAPLLPDETLARVGNLHCHDLITDALTGHYSRRGTPPYLRYLLAGGTGYHRQNVAATISSTPLPGEDTAHALVTMVDRMLAEQPPADGHRATLLDPTSTHIGIGIAARGGWLVSTHEVAVHLAQEVTAPPPVALPGTVLRYAATLPPPWRVRAVELLWEPLPAPLTAAQASAVSSYRYPPRKTISFSQRGREGTFRHAAVVTASGELVEEPRGRLSFRWTAGPRVGVELLVVWASPPTSQDLVPVAAAAIVVTPDGTLPGELGRWVELRGVGKRIFSANHS